MARGPASDDLKWAPTKKCRAGKIAGGVTGLLAGIGVVIALTNALPLENHDYEWVEVVIGALIIVLAAWGGWLTGAIAAGCYGEKPSP